MDRHERFRGMCFCAECCRLRNRKPPTTPRKMAHSPAPRKPKPGELIPVIEGANDRGAMNTAMDEFGNIDIYVKLGHDNVYLGTVDDRDAGVCLYNDYARRYNKIQYNKRLFGGDSW